MCIKGLIHPAQKSVCQQPEQLSQRGSSSLVMYHLQCHVTDTEAVSGDQSKSSRMDAGIDTLLPKRTNWLLLFDTAAMVIGASGSEWLSTSSLSAGALRNRTSDIVRVTAGGSNPSVWVHPEGRNPVDCSNLLRVRSLDDEDSGTDCPECKES